MFHWGRAVVLAFLLFMGFVMFLVYRMNQCKVELVNADYYKQEINYETELRALRKGNEHLPALSWNGNRDTLRVAFKATVTQPVLQLKRAADASLDRQTSLIQETDHVFAYPAANLPPGPWNLELHWLQGLDTCLFKTNLSR